jgi:hypothetical protein
MRRLSIQNAELSHYTSFILFIFYYLCLLYDILFLIRNQGENGYPINYPGYRWFDTFLHIVFGVIHTIYFLNGNVTSITVSLIQHRRNNNESMPKTGSSAWLNRTR